MSGPNDPPLEIDFDDEPVLPVQPVERSHPADEERVVRTPVPYRNGTGRELPRSEEAERYLLSCCFIDGDDVLRKCEEARIGPASFYKEINGTVFKCIYERWRATGSVDVAGVAQILKGTGDLERIGGWPGLMEMSAAVPTTMSAGSLIETVARDATRREIIRLSASAAERAYGGTDPAEMLAEMESDLRRAAAPASVRTPLIGLPDFGIVKEGDGSTLLGQRYLNRGDGAVLVGTSGMGKSSMSIQMATLFALGRPAFGIPPNGPLRSLIVQSEDSEGDVAEMWASMSYMLELPADRQKEVRERVKIQTERVLRGDRFISSLRRTVEQFKPDIVWINPLQAFIDGDVTDSQDLGRFLREGLNGINPCKFGYFIVHHTTKPATGKDKAERLWHEVMYDMAGGAEIINWARAILSLRPVADKEGEFNLVLAKRGRRAGVTKVVDQGAGTRDEVVTTIPLRHAKGFIPGAKVGLKKDLPVIFWEPREADKVPVMKRPTGGKPVPEFSDYRSIFPTRSQPPIPLIELHKRSIQNRPIQKDDLFEALKVWAGDGSVEIVDEPGQPKKYRLAV